MTFQLQKLQHHPVSILRRAIWYWLNAQKVSPFVTHQQVDQLIQAPAESKVSITTGRWISKKVDGSLHYQILEQHRSFSGLQFWNNTVFKSVFSRWFDS